MKLFFKLIFLFILFAAIPCCAQNQGDLKMRGLIRLDEGSSLNIPPGQARQDSRKPAAAVLTAAPAEMPKTVPPVEFGGEKYLFTFSAKDSAGMWLNEYFRHGDSNFETWRRLIGVYYYDGIPLEPLQVGQSMVNNLQAANPEARYSLTRNEKTGDIILDFFTWTPGNAVIEFNVFKITKYKGSTISLQFAHRWYDDGTGKEQQDFVDNFKELRKEWLAAIKSMPVPNPVKREKK